jgi:hypothetical protein
MRYYTKFSKGSELTRAQTEKNKDWQKGENYF